MRLGFQTAVEKEKSEYLTFHYLATPEMNPTSVLESSHHRPDTKLAVSVKDYKLFVAQDMFYSNTGCTAQGLLRFISGFKQQAQRCPSASGCAWFEKTCEMDVHHPSLR